VAPEFGAPVPEAHCSYKTNVFPPCDVMGQPKQATAEMYVPPIDEHMLQLEEELYALNRPPMHARQAIGDVLPEDGLYVPAAHARQED